MNRTNAAPKPVSRIDGYPIVSLRSRRPAHGVWASNVTANHCPLLGMHSFSAAGPVEPATLPSAPPGGAPSDPHFNAQQSGCRETTPNPQRDRTWVITHALLILCAYAQELGNGIALAQRVSRNPKRGSVPLRSRRRLSRCVKRNRAVTASPSHKRAPRSPMSRSRIGREAPAVNEASEAILETHAATANNARAPNNACGERTRNTPAAVATPLPPRKRANNENTCPRIAQAPARASPHGPRPSATPRRTAREPFATSARSVRTPKRTPTVRATFVAPMLPLPRDRTSTPRDRPNQRPVGIDPRT